MRRSPKSHTPAGITHWLRDDDEATINPNVLTRQDLLEMAKIKVKQGESKRNNNNCNKEQSATPPAPPKPAPTRRTTKTAAKEEAYNNQHNCTDHNNAREMTINGFIGCNCTLKGNNVLEKNGDKAKDNVDDARTPMPRPLVIDPRAAKTVIPSDWFPNHKVEESAGSRSGVYYTTADGYTGAQRKREDAHHVHTGWPTLEGDDFPGGRCEQSAGISVQDREQRWQGRLRHGWELHREQMVQ